MVLHVNIAATMKENKFWGVSSEPIVVNLGFLECNNHAQSLHSLESINLGCLMIEGTNGFHDHEVPWSGASDFSIRDQLPVVGQAYQRLLATQKNRRGNCVIVF